ncbi:MAG: helix-turn-helix domain-containing protein, partial [Candidatus Omnitrophota bacterium]
MDKNYKQILAQDEVFSLAEVSAYLKIPKSTIYKLCQKGKLPAVKIGKQL